VPAGSLFDLSGRVALITGASRGIGSAIAELLAEHGASVVLSSRKQADLDAEAERINSSHPEKAIAIAAHAGRPEELERLVQAVMERFSRIDILVNNAGTVWGAPPEETPLHGWQKVIDVNLTGVFLFAQAAGRVMIADRGGGKIINIASIAGLGGAPPEIVNAIPYNASKGGVIAFTRDLACKWARHGINVNAIAPGWFPSEMSRLVLERNPGLVDRIPLRRFGGTDDLKGAILFLSSPASNYVTGHTLVVDGGQSAW
jgi:NAD(P)-dependent dehydrogenase (short-subunit alcohol dehydrogenase family)